VFTHTNTAVGRLYTEIAANTIAVDETQSFLLLCEVEVVNSREVPMISNVVSRELPKVRGRQYETLHDRTCTINAHW